MDNISFDQDNSIDIGFEATILKDCVYLEITDDMYGDSESGFGACLTYSLSKPQAVELRDLLDEFLSKDI